MEEIFLWEVFSKEHNIRFDGSGAERAGGDVVIHYSSLENTQKKTLQIHGTQILRNLVVESTYFSLFSRIWSVAQVAGSCGKTTVGLHEFVIRDATHCGEEL